jgi:Kef-type K+ transport system membrane component KefB
LWGNTFIIAGKEAGPDGQLFRIGVLGISAYLAGVAVQTIGLPPLLGMLIMGIVLRNTGSVEIKGPYLVLTADIRFVHRSICHSPGGSH